MSEPEQALVIGGRSEPTESAPSPEGPVRATSLLQWVVLAAFVYFIGGLLPVFGLEAAVASELRAASGFSGLFTESLPLVPVIGLSAPTLLLVQGVLLLIGKIEAPRARHVGLLLYLAISLVHAVSLALWLESLNGALPYGDLVLEPGWGFRLRTIAALTGGAVILWAVFGRIDRSGRAYGVLICGLLLVVSRVIGNAWVTGVHVSRGDAGALDLLGVLIEPAALASVALVLWARPSAWPVTLGGGLRLRSIWDALGLPTLGGLLATAAWFGEASAARWGAALGVGVASLGLAVLWLRRPKDEVATRSLGPALLCIGGGVITVMTLLASLGLSGGMGRLFAEGPLAGDASFTLVLRADGRFGPGDSAAMVQRIVDGGAAARVEAQNASEITLAVHAARDVDAVLDALRPRRLELRFVREFGDDPLAGMPGLHAQTSTSSGPSPLTVAWMAACPLADRVSVDGLDCELAIEPPGFASATSCTIRCLEPEVVLSSSDIAVARAHVDPYGSGHMVQFSLKDHARERFAEASGANIGRILAFVIDGQVVSAPTLQARIGGGQVQVTLGGDPGSPEQEREAAALARALQPGAQISTSFQVYAVDGDLVRPDAGFPPHRGAPVGSPHDEP